MKKIVAEKYRDIDFSRAKRGAVVKPEPGKTKISIRLDNTVLEYFRSLVDNAGGGNYQTLINEGLLEYVHRRSTGRMFQRGSRYRAPGGPGRTSSLRNRPSVEATTADSPVRSLTANPKPQRPSLTLKQFRDGYRLAFLYPSASWAMIIFWMFEEPSTIW